jgi:hypothetical protein
MVRLAALAPAKMELGGLEPPTSWVRSAAGRQRSRSTMRDTGGLRGFGLPVFWGVSGRFGPPGALVGQNEGTRPAAKSLARTRGSSAAVDGVPCPRRAHRPARALLRGRRRRSGTHRRRTEQERVALASGSASLGVASAIAGVRVTQEHHRLGLLGDDVLQRIAQELEGSIVQERRVVDALRLDRVTERQVELELEGGAA